MQSQILKVAAEAARPSRNDSYRELILDAAFHLSNVASEGEERHARLARLIEQLVSSCPPLVKSCDFVVSRLVEGLPTASSRHYWPLQVSLRHLDRPEHDKTLDLDSEKANR